jgi:hypothetical protein
MKRLILLIILLLLPVQVWGAAYHVSTTGSNTFPYDTPAKGATTVKTVIDAIKASSSGGGDTIVIGAGTFSSDNDYFYLNDVDCSNLTVLGAGKDLTNISTSAGANLNVVAGTDTAPGLIMSDMTLTVNAAAKRAMLKTANSGTWNLSRMKFVSGPSHANQLLFLQGDITNIDHCDFLVTYSGNGYPIYMTGDSSGTISYCLSQAKADQLYGNYWSFAQTGSVNVFNCNILDSSNYGVLMNNASGTLILRNNIIQGGLLTRNATITRAAGTLFESNNLIISSWQNGDGLFASGFTPDATDVLTALPEWKSYSRAGYIIPCVDDSGNFPYAQAVAGLLTDKGFKGTFFLNRYKTYALRATDNGWNTSDDAALRTMVTDGTMEVAIHSAAHSDMTLTDDATIWTVGTGSVTMARTGGTDGNGLITYSGGGTVDQFRIKTLATIKLELNALGANLSDGAIYNSGECTTNKIQDTALGEVIKEAAAGTTSIALYVDTTVANGGLYKAEMADPKAWLADTIINGEGNVTDPQTGATYVCNSFASPYNAWNAAGATAASNAGFIGARGNMDFSWTTHINPQRVYCISSNWLVGADETATRRNARAIAFAAMQNGLVIAVLSHDTGETSLTDWGYILDEWSKLPGSSLNVTSMQLVAKAIVSSGSWTNNGDGTWSRTFTDVSDFHLQSTSPAIDAAADLCGILGTATDFDGMPVCAAGAYVGEGIDSEIGAYEYLSTLPQEPLTVTAVDPGDGSQNVLLCLSLGVWFSANLDHNTITNDNVFVTDPMGSRQSCTLYSDANSLYIYLNNPLAPETTYTIHVTTAVKDIAGESLGSEFTSSFTTAGVILTVTSFTIDNGAAGTTSRNVTLNSTCTGEPVYYMASEAPDFAGAMWQTYSAAPNFALSFGYGSKTVHFKVKNACGESAAVSDTIELQPVPPRVISFSINNGAASTTSQNVILSNTCTENPTHYMASESANFTGAGWNLYSASPSLTLSPGIGVKTVYFKVKNSAGESTPLSSTITLNASLTVTNPGATEIWPIGSTQTIRWTSNGVTGYVKIELSRDGGASWATLLFMTPNDGVQSWKVTGPATTQAMIRIKSMSNPNIFGISGATFTIGGGTITVTAPNGGEAWIIGSTRAITWTSSGITGYVKIELSRNGGTSWTTLLSGTFNDGLQSWRVTRPATTQALIRITSLSDSGAVDTSNSNFSIQ